MITFNSIVSKRIFYVLTVTHLFVAQMGAMQNSLVKKDENQVKNNVIQSGIPLSLSRYHHQTVVLPAESEKGFPLFFEQMDKSSSCHGFVTQYLLDGQCVGRLLQIGNGIQFRSKHTTPYNFLLQSSLDNVGFVKISTNGAFSFQEPAEVYSMSISSKLVEFLNTFSSKTDLTIAAEECRNTSAIKCKHVSFTGNRFKNQSGSVLSADNGAIFDAKEWLCNYGRLFCQNNASISATFLENWGAIRSKNMVLGGKKFINQGSIESKDSLSGICELFEHYGSCDVKNDCILQKVSEFFSAPCSLWNVGSDWKADIAHMCLQGQTVVGKSALLNVNTHAIFGGLLRAPIIHVNSNNLISCHFAARLIASHHIGLVAKGSLQCDGNFLKKSVRFKNKLKRLKKLGNRLSFFPNGIFLYSEKSDICKAGNVVTEDGNLCFEAQGKIIDSGITAAMGQDALCVMHGKDVLLKESSALIVANADLDGRESLDAGGLISATNHVSVRAKFVDTEGLVKADSAHVNADRHMRNRWTGDFFIKNGFSIDALSLLNSGGSMHAHNLAINAGVSCNLLGIYGARNLNVNGLVNINAGLVVPHFDSLSDFFSRENAWKVGEYLFSRCAPTPALVYSLFKNVAGVYGQSIALYQQLERIRVQESSGASDAIALLCGVKNLYKSSMQTISMGKSVRSGLYSLKNSFSSEINTTVSSDNAQANAIDWNGLAKNTTSDLVSLLGPQFNSESLIDANHGAVLGINLNSSNWNHHNSGISLCANKNSIDVCHGTSDGYLLAAFPTVKSNGTYRNKGFIGGVDIYAEVNNPWTIWFVSNGLFVGGKVCALNSAVFKANHYASLSGDIEAYRASVYSGNKMSIFSGAHLKAFEASIIADRLLNHWGKVDTQKNLYMNASTIKHNGLSGSNDVVVKCGWFDGAKKSCITAKTGVIQADWWLKNAGAVEVDQLGMRSKYVDLEDGSCVKARVVQVEAEDSVKNNGGVECEIGFVKAGNSVKDNGRTNAAEFFGVQSKNVSLEKESHVKARIIQVDAENNLDNKAAVEFEQAFFKAGNCVTDNGNMNGSECASIHGKNIKLEKESHITVPIIQAIAENNVDNKATLEFEKCLLQAGNCVTDSGNMSGSESASVQGKDIKLEKESHINAPIIQAIAENNVDTKATLEFEKCLLQAGNRVDGDGTMLGSEFLRVQGNDVDIKRSAVARAPITQMIAENDCANKGRVEFKDGLLKAGNCARNDGHVISSGEFVASGKDVVFGWDSHVEAQKGGVVADRYHRNSGYVNIVKHMTPDEAQRAADQLSNENIGLVSQELADFSIESAVDTSGQVGKKKYNGRFDVRCSYGLNTGGISVDSFGAQASWWWANLFGRIQAKEDASINAPLSMNIFGSLDAKSIEINSLVDVNWYGAYAGHNIAMNSLISYNRGLVLPKHQSSDALMTKYNAQLLAKSLVARYIPLVGFASAVYGLQDLPDRSKKLKDRVRDLYNRRGEIDLSDIIPVVCHAKNLALPVVQTFIQGCQLASDGYDAACPIAEAGCQSVQNYYNQFSVKDFKNAISMENISQCVADRYQGLRNVVTLENILQQGGTAYNNGVDSLIKAKLYVVEHPQEIMQHAKNYAYNGSLEVAKSAYSVFGPLVIRHTLVDINDGLMLGGNGSSLSLYHGNNGASCFINNSISAVYGSNTGFLGAGNLSVAMHKGYKSIGIFGGLNTSATAHDLDVSGYTVGNTSFKARNKAIMDATSIGFKHYSLQATVAELKSNNHVSGDAASFDVESLIGQEGNTLDSQFTSIKTRHIDNNGSNSGALALQFTGTEDQLNRIGNVNHLQYSGTLTNDLADTFVDGHNDVLDVAADGSVKLFLGHQDVHIKEAHDITHGFQAETKGSIACDKPITSEQPILLDAGQALTHDTLKSKKYVGTIGKDVHAKSTVERVYTGENYEDVLNQTSIEAPQVYICAHNTLTHDAVKVTSGKEGTQIYVGGNFLSNAVEGQSYVAHDPNVTDGWLWSKETELVTEPNTTSHVSEYNSEGATNFYLNEQPEFCGTKFNSAGGTNFNVPNGPGFNVVYDIHEKEVEWDKTGISPDKIMRKEETHVPVCPDFQGGPVSINSDVPVVLPITGNAEMTVNAPAAAYVPVETESVSYESESGERLRLFAVDKTKSSRDVVYDKVYKGQIKANVSFMHVTDVEGHEPVDVVMVNPNGKITHSMAKEVHDCKTTAYHRPTKPCMLLLATVLSLVTSGAYSSVGAGLAAKVCLKETLAAAMIQRMSASALMMVSQQAMESLLYCNGDLKAAAKQFGNTETGKKFVYSVLTAGAMAGAHYGLDQVIPTVSDATTLGERFAYTIPRQAANAGINTIAGIASGGDPKEVIKDNAKMMAANTIGIAGSSHIGKAYHDKKIGFASHKAAHVALGAVEGAIVNGLDGAMAGGLAAGIAEIAADVFGPEAPSVEHIFEIEAQVGRQLTSEEFKCIWTEQNKIYTDNAHAIADMSKIAAMSAALLLQQDIDVAYDTASIAVDNNFLNIVQFAVVGADIAQIGYNAVVAYQEGGMEDALKQIGVDVQYTVQNYVICGAVFSVGGAAYPSLKKALDAAFNMQPGLKAALGGFAETLYVGGKKFFQSTPGKHVARFGKSINELDAKLGDFKQKGANKFFQQFEVGLEGLVENSVPSGVLNNVEKQVAKKAAKSGAVGVEKTLAAEASLVVQEAKVVSDAGAQDVVKKTKGVRTESQMFLENYAKEFLNESSPELATLKNTFVKCEQINGEWLKPDYEHIFGMEIGWTKKMKPKIGGFHHDFGNKVVESNVFEYANKVVYGNGAWKADLFYRGDYVKEITFFPSDWSREKVVNKIFEAYRNAIKSGVELKIDDKGKYLINGFTNEGMIIEMRIAKSGHIKTVFPVAKERH